MKSVLSLCLAVCIVAMTSVAPATAMHPDCLLIKHPGPCLAYMPSFYYNVRTKRCESFIYGGCGGNRNNFGSKASCERKCLS